MDLELQLRNEERRHRDGIPGMRRDVADLLLTAAEEIKRLRSELALLGPVTTPLNGKQCTSCGRDCCDDWTYCPSCGSKGRHNDRSTRIINRKT